MLPSLPSNTIALCYARWPRFRPSCRGTFQRVILVSWSWLGRMADTSVILPSQQVVEIRFLLFLSSPPGGFSFVKINHSLFIDWKYMNYTLASYKTNHNELLIPYQPQEVYKLPTYSYREGNVDLRHTLFQQSPLSLLFDYLEGFHPSRLWSLNLESALFWWEVEKTECKLHSLQMECELQPEINKDIKFYKMNQSENIKVIVYTSENFCHAEVFLIFVKFQRKEHNKYY